MTIPTPRPSLQRVSALSSVLQEDEALQKHFNMDRAFDRLMDKKISDAQIRRFYALIYNKKRFELNTMVTQFGFPQK